MFGHPMISPPPPPIVVKKLLILHAEHRVVDFLYIAPVVLE